MEFEGAGVVEAEGVEEKSLQPVTPPHRINGSMTTMRELRISPRQPIRNLLCETNGDIPLGDVLSVPVLF